MKGKALGGIAGRKADRNIGFEPFPGFGPKGIHRFVLPFTVFLKLKDIGGNVLPDYQEEFVDVPMSPEQASPPFAYPHSPPLARPAPRLALIAAVAANGVLGSISVASRSAMWARESPVFAT